MQVTMFSSKDTEMAGSICESTSFIEIKGQHKDATFSACVHFPSVEALTTFCKKHNIEIRGTRKGSHNENRN